MTATPEPHMSSWRTPMIVVVAGCLIAMFGFGIRSIYGFYLEPLSAARGWDREVFSLAMAIQYLLWGAAVPFAGAISDRWGSIWAIMVGALLYAGGTAAMALVESEALLYLFGGVITGIGVGFTAFTIALAAMVKVVEPARRSLVLGIGTSAGSFGQVVFSPIGQALIQSYGWQPSLLILSALVLVIVPLAFCLPADPSVRGEIEMNQSMRSALDEARTHRGFVLLTIGFFVCGFHVAFIYVHFPAYVKDLGLSANIAVWSLSLVGVFNIIGAFAAGAAGQRWSKKGGLSMIYFTRSVVIAIFLIAPKTGLNVLIFASAMGLLWLSTVPLTSGIIAQVFGARYMTTLFGIVFFSHQLGSFTGIWLGGKIYDLAGSYEPMWVVSIGMGVLAALIHLPINERPLARLKPQPQAAE